MFERDKLRKAIEIKRREKNYVELNNTEIQKHKNIGIYVFAQNSSVIAAGAGMRYL